MEITGFWSVALRSRPVTWWHAQGCIAQEQRAAVCLDWYPKLTLELKSLPLRWPLLGRAYEVLQIGYAFSARPRRLDYLIPICLPGGFNIPLPACRITFILNRFTRSLSIISATSTTIHILGVQPDYLKDKSFYDLIHDDDRAQTVACLERVKTYDSIIHMQFKLKQVVQDKVFQDLERDVLEGGISARDVEQKNPRTFWGQQDIFKLEMEAIAIGTSDGLVVMVH